MDNIGGLLPQYAKGLKTSRLPHCSVVIKEACLEMMCNFVNWTFTHGLHALNHVGLS